MDPLFELVALTRLRIPGKAVPRASTMDLAALSAQLGRPLRVAAARFDGIGDWILTLPIMGALKASPAVESVELVGPGAHRSLLDQGQADGYVRFEAGTVLHPPPPGGLLGKVRVTSFIGGAAARAEGRRQAGRYDVVILPRWDTDLGQNARLWAAGTGALVLGFDPASVPGLTRVERGEGRLLSASCPLGDPAAHETKHLATLMRHLGLPDSIGDDFGADYFNAPHAPATDARGRHVVAMHTTSVEPKRHWPKERWAELIGELVTTTDYDVQLVGAPSERDALAELAAPHPDRVEVLAGEPLDRLPARLASATAFVGNDSGPMHVAASLGLPVVGVSPHPRDGDPAHRNSPVRFGPASSRARVLQPAHGLDGCTTACVATTPHCITQVRVADVLDALASLGVITR